MWDNSGLVDRLVMLPGGNKYRIVLSDQNALSRIYLNSSIFNFTIYVNSF
jgi:hypothetical protein